MNRLRSMVVSVALILIGTAGMIAAQAVLEAKLVGAATDVAARSSAPPIGRATRAAGQLKGAPDADRKRVERTLQRIVENLLFDRLGPGHRFELSDIEHLHLAHSGAEVRVWGLLFDRHGAPSMLRVDMRLDRTALAAIGTEIRAYTSNGIDVERTAWLAEDRADASRSGVQHAVARR